MGSSRKHGSNKENIPPPAKRTKSNYKASGSRRQATDSDSDNVPLTRRLAPRSPNQMEPIDLSNSSPPPPPPQPKPDPPHYSTLRPRFITVMAQTSHDPIISMRDTIVISDDDDDEEEEVNMDDGEVGNKHHQAVSHVDVDDHDVQGEPLGGSHISRAEDDVGDGDDEVEEEGRDEEEEDDEEEEEFELDDNAPEVTVDMMKRLAARDVTITEEERKRIKHVDAAVDRWILSYIERQYAEVTNESKELAAICSDVIKRIVAEESKGLFIYNNGRINKAFPFRSSFRDVFLRDHEGDQLVDKALALLLHAGSEELSDSFYRLFESGSTGTLDLIGPFEDGIPARNATKEVGIYLRRISGFDFYVGISRDIAQRQRQHNAGKAGHQGNSKTRKALAGREAGDIVVSRRLASFGKTGLSEIPQPVLHCIETLLIGAARLTTSSKSLQVNIVDSPPYAPPRPPANLTEYTAKGTILAKVWKGLYRYFQDQLNDFALGKYMRHGLRPVPVGIDGVSRAELEARMIIIPIIRKERVGLSWIYGNLFREVIFEKDGEMVSQSSYAELREAKAKFPIPISAFYQPKNIRQHRAYLAQGLNNIPLGHYAPWSSKLGDLNGYKILGGEGPHGTLFGKRTQSRLSKRDQEVTLAQARQLFKAVVMLGVNGLSPSG